MTKATPVTTTQPTITVIFRNSKIVKRSPLLANTTINYFNQKVYSKMTGRSAVTVEEVAKIMALAVNMRTAS